MRRKLAYHPRMRYWTLVAAVSLAGIVAVAAGAQVNGTPPSVTSYGFGGNPGFHGVPPSVTSPGTSGLGRGTGQGHFVQTPLPPPLRHHHHVHVYPYFIPYYPAVDAYGYNGPIDEWAYSDSPDADEYLGGPTIFDRRGNGTPYADNSRGDPVTRAVPMPGPEQDAQADPPAPEAPPSPAASEPSTILIFKDGHRQEVGNYAIFGSSLFDLTPGHRLKVSLLDLDVAATETANEDNGVEFKLPSLPEGH
jgi:hypothetical protein